MDVSDCDRGVCVQHTAVREKKGGGGSVKESESKRESEREREREIGRAHV